MSLQIYLYDFHCFIFFITSLFYLYFNIFIFPHHSFLLKFTLLCPPESLFLCSYIPSFYLRYGELAFSRVQDFLLMGMFSFLLTYTYTFSALYSSLFFAILYIILSIFNPIAIIACAFFSGFFSLFLNSSYFFSFLYCAFFLILLHSILFSLIMAVPVLLFLFFLFVVLNFFHIGSIQLISLFVSSF